MNKRYSFIDQKSINNISNKAFTTEDVINTNYKLEKIDNINLQIE